jgi:hypothetical protein
MEDVLIVSTNASISESGTVRGLEFANDPLQLL